MQMDLKNKRIGVWGYGITGKSTVAWALKHDAQVGVMDAQELPDQKEYFAEHNIQFYPQEKSEDFFTQHDLVIPSAGIDLRPFYQKYKDKWLFELDIFAQEFKKPYIAITGSVGKTTVTTLLAQILERYGKKVKAGGNIGVASLDLLNLQDEIEIAVLEVSSFQLEYTTQFAPELAIITNIMENHLDRHGTMEAYINAKLNILNRAHHRLIPEELLALLTPTQKTKTTVLSSEPYKNIIANLPPITFDQNWIVITTALDMIKLPIAQLPMNTQDLKMPEHRLEYVTSINGTRYYNDSKSTAPAATLAAVNCLQNAPIHLLLGGLSKGINREPLIAQLHGKVKKVYCFGKESDVLDALCHKYKIPTHSCATLEQAVEVSHSSAQPGEVILLSPAGSSYDLFENFEHRGKAFKAAIKALSDK